MQVAGPLLPQKAISSWQLAFSQTVHRKGRKGRQVGRDSVPISFAIFASIGVGSQADVECLF
jgi:hypothetical protein